MCLESDIVFRGIRTQRRAHIFPYWRMGKYAFLALRALVSGETLNLDFLHTEAVSVLKEVNRAIQKPGQIWRATLEITWQSCVPNCTLPCACRHAAHSRCSAKVLSHCSLWLIDKLLDLRRHFRTNKQNTQQFLMKMCHLGGQRVHWHLMQTAFSLFCSLNYMPFTVCVQC